MGGFGKSGSMYLKGSANQESEENWDNESAESIEEDFSKCDERPEFIFDNGARYKG